MLRDPENIERRFLHDLLGPSAGDVLEIGCGDGRLTAELLSIANTIMALDPDADSIGKARHLIGRGVKLILGSGEHIPLPDGSVDTVVFSLSLHHHLDPGNALIQARRVLKEGGRILVLEPEPEAPTNQLYRVIDDEDEAYDRASEALERCGARMEGRGSFTSTWKFDDFREMVAYLFGYFDMEPVQLQVRIMEDILGDKAKERPLEVEDSTRWWLLTSTSST